MVTRELKTGNGHADRRSAEAGDAPPSSLLSLKDRVLRNWLGALVPSHEPAPIVVAGHSHVICFGIAPIKDEAARLVELRAEPRVLGVQAPFLGSDPEVFSSMICGLARGHRLVVLWSGWSDLLFMGDPLFDFVSSAFPELPLEPAATPVAEQMVRTHESLRHYPSMMVHYLEQFQNAGVRSLTVLSQPPPKRSSDVIRNRLFTERILVDRAKAQGFDIATAPITPPFIRLKLWGLIHQMNRDAAEKVGARYLQVPRESQDEHGFLREEYWGNDVMHANERYGRLYLDHVVAALHGTPPRTP